VLLGMNKIPYNNVMAKQKRTTKVDKQKDLAKLRHSVSHLLAEAVTNLYPDVKLGFGPATEDGFYYDFEFKKPISETDLPRIESEMIKLLKDKRVFKKSDKTVAQALNWAKKNNQPYKTELIKELKKAGNKQIGFYTSGEFTDVCEGPHVKDSNEIKAFKLLSVAGAYWRGDEKNPQLVRIYGTAFKNQSDLDEYLLMIEEAKKRDHRVLGEQLDLFSFHPEGPGFPFWHPKGQFLFNKIIEYMRGVLKENNYQEISTPLVLNEELWHKSGHWDNYKDDMYFTKVDANNYALKPMNCPGGVLVFGNTLRSYKELPLRMGEFGMVHRHELSGVLHGLFRVRSFTQDDAHVYCTEEQIKDEIKALIRMIQKVYKDFGFNNYRIELSTKPAKAIGSEAIWKKSEKIMKDVAKEEKLDIEINPGDGAFYGPKFDFHITDVLNRSWQLGTIQLDFSMPERLGVTYIDKDGKKKTPIMIHRAILGSLERFIGILIEHYAGAFPYWLSPVQVAILPISEQENKYANKVMQELESKNIQVIIDDRNESLGRKIRDAEMQKVPKMLIIGPKEVKAKSVTIRDFEKGDLGSKKLDLAIKELTDFKSPIK